MHCAPATGSDSIQRSTFRPPETLYAPVGGSHQQEMFYAPASGSIQSSTFRQPETLHHFANVSLQRSPSGQSETLYPPTGGSHQRGDFGQPGTLYTPDSVSVQCSPSGQSATLYTPASSSVQHTPSEQSSTYYPSAQTFVSTSTSYFGPQRTHYAAPYGHGTNASDGSRSSHLYQTAVPAVTHVTAEPTYEGTQGGDSQPQRPDAYALAYAYGGEGHTGMSENRPKSPGRGPVQGHRG